MLFLTTLFTILSVNFSKPEFFKTLESGNSESITALEKKLSSTPSNDDQKAYYGTILMKSAEYKKTAGDKLKKFKEGKLLLENAIKSQPNNAEYRFLRLMIQENAPKVLKYNTKIKEDIDFIKNNLSKTPAEIKTAITNYSKVSPNLKL